MSFKKQFVKTKPVCKDIFLVEVKTASIVLDMVGFNNWSLEEGTLRELKMMLLKVF